MTAPSEYDARQLNLLLEAIQSYEQGVISLDHLISNFDALLCVLQDQTHAEIESIRSALIDLEEVNVVEFIEEQRSALSPQGSQIVADALIRLRTLLTNILAKV